MFGTVARLTMKAGVEPRFRELMNEYERLDIPGFVATHIYHMDDNPDEYFLTAIFRDRDSYVANASSPEQDARYRKMRECLMSDPEWHDGEIIFSQTGAETMTH